MEFHQVLKRRRNGLGLTQRQIGEWLGIRAVNVSDWERGEGMPETRRLPALGRILQLTVSELMGQIRADDPRLSSGIHLVDGATVGKADKLDDQANLFTPGPALIWVSPWEMVTTDAA